MAQALSSKACFGEQKTLINKQEFNHLNQR